MKYYLLVAGSHYYPQSRTGDWIDTFASYEEASSQVEEIVTHQYYTKGKKKGQIQYSTSEYKINGNTYDWFEIVDLREWIEK